VQKRKSGSEMSLRKETRDKERRTEREEGQPDGVGATGRHTFPAVAEQLPDVVVGTVGVVQEVIVADIAEVLRVLDGDADRELTGPTEPVGSRRGHGVFLRAEEWEGIIPKDVWLDKSMPGINNPDERLDPGG
jgi:hypothetical protein